MRFEHVVIVNDPANSLVAPIAHAELWRGLLWRAEDARPFMPGLDRCEVLARDGDVLHRRLHFGTTTIDERVTLLDNEAVIFDSEPMADHGGGRLRIAIEHSPAGHLLLRFSYDTRFALGHESEDEQYAGFLRQAYEQADIDTVRVLRQWLHGGSKSEVWQ